MVLHEVRYMIGLIAPLLVQLEVNPKPLVITCTRFPRFVSATYGLLTKCEVKMAAEYWPSIFCMFMDGDGVKV